MTDAQIHERRFDENFRAMMEFLVEDARARMVRGERIVQFVDRDLAATLSLFAKGGHAILDAIAAQDYDTLQARPVVTKADEDAVAGGGAGGESEGDAAAVARGAGARER